MRSVKALVFDHACKNAACVRQSAAVQEKDAMKYKKDSYLIPQVCLER